MISSLGIHNFSQYHITEDFTEQSDFEDSKVEASTFMSPHGPAISESSLPAPSPVLP